jgi:hypothetical protein
MEKKLPYADSRGRRCPGYRLGSNSEARNLWLDFQSELVHESLAGSTHTDVTPASVIVPQKFTRAAIYDAENGVIHQGGPRIRAVTGEIVAEIRVHRKQQDEIGMVAVMDHLVAAPIQQLG